MMNKVWLILFVVSGAFAQDLSKMNNTEHKGANMGQGTSVVSTVNDEHSFMDGITAHKDGTIYVSELYEGAVYRLNQQGNAEVYVTGLPGNPLGLAFDSQDNLYVGLPYQGMVLKVTPEKEVTVVAEGLAMPVGVICDAADNLYIAEFSLAWPPTGDTIYKLEPTSGELSVFSQGGFLQTGPIGMAWADNGDLFAANFGDGVVVRIDPQGEQSRVTQLPNLNSVGIGYLAAMNGKLYATNYGTSQLYEIDTDTGIFQVIAGRGHRGYNDGPGFFAEFDGLNGIAADPAKNTLYVTEWFRTWPRGRIRAIRVK